MSEMKIHWKVERLDEGDEPDLRLAECLLEIEGRIECGGKAAGLVDAHYVFAEDPACTVAFRELWDADARSCRVFEEIIDEDLPKFREPIPDFLDPASGILCVHFIALRPAFRSMGTGREVMRKCVHDMADPRVGLVLLDTTPLQHLPHGYDHFDDEVRDLPWNSPEQDRATLMRHFETWGMKNLPDTRFMMAAPEALRDSRAPQWPPCPVLDRWNVCCGCGGWIDKEGDGFLETDEGSFHKGCE